MTAVATVEVLGRLAFYAMAGAGLALATMSVSLLLFLLRAGSRSAFTTAVHIVLVVAFTAVFWFVLMFALLFAPQTAIAQQLIFVASFLLTAVLLWYAYAHTTPERLASVKRMVASVRKS